MSEEPIRLSKRVMAALGCSRAEAERLIAQGDVRVDGAVQRDPAHRVSAAQDMQVREGARPSMAPAPTVIWHKPPGPAAAPQQVRGLRCAAPLDDAASGLVVFTAHAGVWRVLVQSEPPLEQEWLVDLAGRCTPQALGPAVRASVGSQNDLRTRLRVVARGDWRPPNDMEPLRLHRQRIGRLALAALPEGESRELQLHEKF